MRRASLRSIAVGVSIAIPLLGVSAPVVAQGDGESDIVTIASGLTNPRGFSWGPDGTLYVALAGTGGDTRIPAFEGFTADIGLTSSIATVADGCATPIVQGLVSFLWEEAGWIWGAMDVAFLGEDAYALLSGAGPSYLSPASFSGVFRLNDDGTMTLVADLTSWLPEHPPAFVPPDYGSDGSLFDLEAAGDSLLLSEAVGGQLIRVAPDGEITLVADLSEGHLVPTGIAVDADGNAAYVGHETAAPYGDGASKVVMVTADGTVSDAWTGLTVVTDVAMGPDGALYAAEMATGFTEGVADMPPDSGMIVRQTGPDSSEAVVTDLPYPSYIGFDADGRLVIAAPAFGPDAGVGQGVLVSVDLAQAPVSYAGYEPTSSCAPPEDGAAVTIEGFAFVPPSLDVPVGTTVTWTNEDSTQHTVTADDGSFDSGALAQGATFSHTFDAAGTFTYSCRFHSSMKGTITVG